MSDVPDRDAAERFLTALDPNTDRFTFQSFDDNKDRKDKALARVLHGTLARHFDELVELNERGAGIFVTVNETDLKARKADNIVRVRACFVDLDGAEFPDPPHVLPHIITATSPGRFHLYWRVKDLPLDQFTTTQLRLIARYNSDPVVKDLSRVMRLPGFFHRKSAPFPSRVIEVNDEPAHALNLLVAGLPEPKTTTAQPKTGGDTFWNRVNTAALADRGKWVTLLFPRASYHESVDCYRVTSHDLGRNLQEDLILGADGIRDCGREIGLTPIDCVVDFGTVRTPQGAALWLCDKLGIDAGQLGYVGGGDKKKNTGNGKDEAEAPAVNGQDANAPPLSNVTPCTIDETLAAFEKWLILPSRAPVYAVLGTVAANLLPGDPVWLGLIAPPSSAKTEILNAISTLPYVTQAATLTPAGLLSGTPKKQRSLGARGGLLNQIGKFGIISLKDFGSILSMRPDAKAEVIAALREIYDGRWVRVLGSDGGRQLHWEGKLGVIFGATGVIDSHYAVLGAMGDRFLLSRLAPGPGQFQRALQHAFAATGQMRKELTQAVVRLFAGQRPEPRPLTEDEIERLDRVVSLVVLLRGAIERDRQSREMEAKLGEEGTARIGLTLVGLLAGLDTLGVERDVALDLVEGIAMDSVPPLRRAAYEHLVGAKDLVGDFAEVTTPAIAEALGLPTVTVRRALEDLAAYGLIARHRAKKKGEADNWLARRPP